LDNLSNSNYMRQDWKQCRWPVLKDGEASA